MTNEFYFSRLKQVELDGSRSDDVRLMLIILRKILPRESPSSWKNDLREKFCVSASSLTSCSELSKQRIVNGGFNERKPNNGARVELVTNYRRQWIFEERVSSHYHSLEEKVLVLLDWSLVPMFAKAIWSLDVFDDSHLDRRHSIYKGRCLEMPRVLKIAHFRSSRSTSDDSPEISCCSSGTENMLIHSGFIKVLNPSANVLIWLLMRVYVR